MHRGGALRGRRGRPSSKPQLLDRRGLRYVGPSVLLADPVDRVAVPEITYDTKPLTIREVDTSSLSWKGPSKFIVIVQDVEADSAYIQDKLDIGEAFVTVEVVSEDFGQYLSESMCRSVRGLTVGTPST